MPDDSNIESNDAFWGNSLESVDTAIDRLRRGRPVAIEENGHVFLFIATESLTSSGLSAFRALAQDNGLSTELVISAQRAQTLKLATKGKETLWLNDREHFDASLIRSIADPTHDFDFPLRGPFDINDHKEATLSGAIIALLKASRRLPAAFGLLLTKSAFQDTGALRHMNPLSASLVHDYKNENSQTIDLITRAHVPLAIAENTEIAIYRSQDGRDEFVAISIGDPQTVDAPLVRIHSECFTGDLLLSLKCDCGTQLQEGLKAIAQEGSGILIYLAQEGRGVGLAAKLKAYALQDIGFDTVEANLKLGFAIDERFYMPAANILKSMGCKTIRLLTNNPEKVEALKSAGIQVAERIKHSFPSNTHNEQYLKTKRLKTGHLI